MTTILKIRREIPGWISSSISHLFTVTCLMAVTLACGSGDGNQSRSVDSAAMFALESVELGIGFDEPVLVDGSATAIQRLDATEVILESGSEEKLFGGTLQAVDGAGNMTEFRLEVTVGEGVLQ